METYHLTCSQLFYGQKDAKTYYNVPAAKVWAGMRYMAENFNAATVFVYLKQKNTPIGQNMFIGTFSRKYDNFRTPDNKLHQTFNF